MGEKSGGVKEGVEVKKKKKAENGEALQTEMNAMDCSQRDDDRKEERDGDRTGNQLEREREREVAL